MPDKNEYTISELAQAADVTTRTIRYYVAEELLPSPAGGGRAASYSGEHLARLELIKLLKEEFLPLQEIRTLLSGLDRQAVIELLAQKQKIESPPPAPESAKAYIQMLLQPSGPESPGFMRHRLEARKEEKSEERGDEVDLSPPAPLASATPPQAGLPQGTGVMREATPPPEPPNRAPAAPGEPAGRAEPVSRGLSSVSDRAVKTSGSTRWQRTEITQGVELHVQEGVESHTWQKVQQLIKVAREIFK